MNDGAKRGPGRQAADEPFCYLTTVGRTSGRPHTIEIWFALVDRTLYLLSGGGDRSDWVRNVRRDPSVTVRIGDRSFVGTARMARDAGEDELARSSVHDKYAASTGDDLRRWRAASLPVAVDLDRAP